MRRLLCPLFAPLLACPVLGQVSELTVTAQVGSWEIEPGQVVPAWTFDGTLPGPELRVNQGDLVRFRLRNELPEPTTVHFHGLPVPLAADGVPGVSGPPIGVGQEFTYEFLADTPGTYWYHPHVELQIDRGMYGSIVVVPAAPVDPEFDREYTIVLDDWLPGDPVVVSNPFYSDFLINGRTSAGQSPLTVQEGEVVRLRFVNAAASTPFVVAVDGHPMTVTHSDGQRVVPFVTEAIPIGQGERYDVTITADQPGSWSIAASHLMDRSTTLVRAVLEYQGTAQTPPSASYVPPFLSSGSLLTYAQLASAEPAPLPAAPDRVHALSLDVQGGPGGPKWMINGQAFPNADPILVATGEEVRFDVTNNTHHHHPMHIHGHFFRLVGSAGGNAAPLIKDTLLVDPLAQGGAHQAYFTADNPGNWPYHCHHIYHMALGMMRMVQYEGSDLDADGLADAKDYDPQEDHPILGTSGLGGDYVIGTNIELSAQWPSGEVVQFALGAELPLAIPLEPLGSLALWPFAFVGAAVADATDRAALSLALPNDPSLPGQVVGLQAIASHGTLPGGLRLSKPLRVTVH